MQQTTSFLEDTQETVGVDRMETSYFTPRNSNYPTDTNMMMTERDEGNIETTQYEECHSARRAPLFQMSPTKEQRVQLDPVAESPSAASPVREDTNMSTSWLRELETLLERLPTRREASKRDRDFIQFRTTFFNNYDFQVLRDTAR